MSAASAAAGGGATHPVAAAQDDWDDCLVAVCCAKSDSADYHAAVALTHTLEVARKAGLAQLANQGVPPEQRQQEDWLYGNDLASFTTAGATWLPAETVCVHLRKGRKFDPSHPDPAAYKVTAALPRFRELWYGGSEKNTAWPPYARMILPSQQQQLQLALADRENAIQQSQRCLAYYKGLGPLAAESPVADGAGASADAGDAGDATQALAKADAARATAAAALKKRKPGPKAQRAGSGAAGAASSAPAAAKKPKRGDADVTVTPLPQFRGCSPLLDTPLTTQAMWEIGVRLDDKCKRLTHGPPPYHVRGIAEEPSREVMEVLADDAARAERARVHVSTIGVITQSDTLGARGAASKNSTVAIIFRKRGGAAGLPYLNDDGNLKFMTDPYAGYYPEGVLFARPTDDGGAYIDTVCAAEKTTATSLKRGDFIDDDAFAAAQAALTNDKDAVGRLGTPLLHTFLTLVKSGIVRMGRPPMQTRLPRTIAELSSIAPQITYYLRYGFNLRKDCYSPIAPFPAAFQKRIESGAVPKATEFNSSDKSFRLREDELFTFLEGLTLRGLGTDRFGYSMAYCRDDRARRDRRSSIAAADEEAAAAAADSDADDAYGHELQVKDLDTTPDRRAPSKVRASPVPIRRLPRAGGAAGAAGAAPAGSGEAAAREPRGTAAAAEQQRLAAARRDAIAEARAHAEADDEGELADSAYASILQLVEAETRASARILKSGT